MLENWAAKKKKRSVNGQMGAAAEPLVALINCTNELVMRMVTLIIKLMPECQARQCLGRQGSFDAKS